MKTINKKTIIIAISTLVTGMLIGGLIFNNSSDPITDEHNHTNQVEEQTIWTCSMHPQIRKNEPGNCPICGMDLIPLESLDNELDPMAVSMSPIAMQLAQVQTMVVDKGRAEKSIRLNGKVQADERLLYTQPSHIPGRIEKLSVNFTGEFVSAGQILAYVYSPELVTAQEELFQAKKIKDSQPALFNAAKEKLKNWKLTDKQIDQIEASNNTIEQFPILANVSGYVTKKMVNLGDYINEGEALYEIADLSKVWVLFDVYESDMEWINKGDEVICTIQSLPGKTFNGRVSYVDPVINPKTRVAKARIETTNEGLQLKPEMFASGIVKAKTNSNNASITVPKTAVMWTGKRSVVYVMQKSAQGVSFRMREITLGPELGESYVIESGLQLGEEIAVNGTFSIDAAAQLAGKPSMMNSEGGVVMAGHNHGGTSNKINNTTPNDSRAIDISAKTKEALNPLFDEYLKLKDALVADEFEKSQQIASTILSDLDNIKMTDFSGEAHNIWMQHSIELKKSLNAITMAENIGGVRRYLRIISDEYISIAKTFQPYKSTLYIQYCPMANDNGGAYWLSKSKKIRNPYFGKSMLNCGETRDSVKIN